MERAWLSAQRNVNTETRTTLGSDFHDFRVEYAANKIILLFLLQTDNNISHFIYN